MGEVGEEGSREIDEVMAIYCGPRVPPTKAAVNLLKDLLGWCVENGVSFDRAVAAVATAKAVVKVATLALAAGLFVG